MKVVWQVWMVQCRASICRYQYVGHYHLLNAFTLLNGAQCTTKYYLQEHLQHSLTLLWKGYIRIHPTHCIYIRSQRKLLLLLKQDSFQESEILYTLIYKFIIITYVGVLSVCRPFWGLFRHTIAFAVGPRHLGVFSQAPVLVSHQFGFSKIWRT